MSELTASAAWQALLDERQQLDGFSLTDAFADNRNRATQFSVEAAGLLLDYSKHLIRKATIDKLLALTEFSQLRQAIDALLAGELVNNTEQRAALHYLLRAQSADAVPTELQPLYAEVTEVKARMRATAEKVLNGQLRGYTGKPFTDIVHIGIGGSDLGPAMVYQALTPYHQAGIRCHFVANICANDITEVLSDLTADTTLFILASKSFTTLETLQNAKTARAWLLHKLLDEEAIGTHFYAVSSKPELAKAWGIKVENVFPFRDWVGGRYSVWSAIGLSLCIGLGYDNFNAFLSGAAAMDQHFAEADFSENLPVIMALLGIWYTNFWQRQAHVVVPYDHRLRRLPAYMQQLEMESNGKSATRDNRPIDYDTCPDLWGEAGSNSQHSFFQQLHQGTEFTPVDFLAVLKSPHGLQEHQDWLFANCLAQSRALMLGQTEADPAFSQHKFMPGNRPSTTLVMSELTPASLGAVMALYEHKTYTQSVIWQVNAFDQWGVELGKKISKELHAAIVGNTAHDDFDGSTQQLLQRYQQQR